MEKVKKIKNHGLNSSAAERSAQWAACIVFAWGQRRSPPRAGALTVVAAAIALLVSASQVVAADAATPITFEIAAGPLQNALTSFAQRAGVSIKFEPVMVSGRMSPGVQGRYTVGEALAKLLQGTSLAGSHNAQGDYILTIISPEVPPRPAVPSPVAAKPLAVSGPGSLKLPGINVTDALEEPATAGLVAHRSSSATNTDTPIADIPRGVITATQDLIERQQVRSVEEVLRNISGVTTSNDGQNFIVTVRGFASATTTIDGLRSGISNYPMAGVQSVEVLKGADQVLRGAGTPGGMVNVELKKPQAEPVRQLVAEIGTLGHLLTSLDLAGALSDDERWTYRLITSAEHDNKNPAGFKGKQQYYLAPSLGFRSGGTEMTGGFESSRSPRQPYGGSALITSENKILPPSFPYSNFYDHGELEQNMLHAELKQKLVDSWQLEVKARHTDESNTFSSWSPNLVDASMLPIVSFRGTNFASTNKTTDGQIVLTGDAQTGPLRHKLSFGLAGSRNTRTSAFWLVPDASSDYRTAGTGLPRIEAGPSESANFDEKAYRQQAYSFQDQVKFSRFTVLGSVVHTLTDFPPDIGAEGRTKDKVNSPSIGAVYALTDEWNVYGSRQTGLTPGDGRQLDGSPLPPIDYKTRQAGLKYNRLDGQFTATFEVYKNESQNVGVRIPGTNFFRLSRGQTSKGVEVDLAGKMLPGLDVLVSYTYGQSALSEVPFPNQIPKHKFRVWSEYALPGNALRGWSVSAGLDGQSSYNGSALNNPDGIRFAGGASVDFGVAYKARTWLTTLGFKNVLDRTLYETGGGITIVGIRDRRAATLTTRFDF